MTPLELQYMSHELQKTAGPMQSAARVARQLLSREGLRSAGRIGTSGAVQGGVIGGGLGAAGGAIKAKSEGKSVGRGAAKGLIGGAALGAGIGGAGRAYRDTKLLNPGMSGGKAVGETFRRAGRGIKRFGQRQLHGFTGKGDPAEMGLRGTATSNRKIDLLRRRLDDDLQHVTDPNRRRKLQEKFEGRVKDLRDEAQRGDRAYAAGATSIPGTFKGLMNKDTRGETAKALWQETTGGSVGGTAMALGLPLALSGPELMRGDESDKGGRSMSQKLVGLGTGLGGAYLTAGLPIVPAMAAGIGVDSMGQAVTRKKKNKGVR